MKLTDSVLDCFRLVETQKKALKRLRIETIEDLLYHFPTRYENISDIKHVSSLLKGDSAILYGKLLGLKTKKSFKSRVPILLIAVTLMLSHKQTYRLDTESL